MDTPIPPQGVKTAGAVGALIKLVRGIIVGLTFPDQVSALAAVGVVIFIAGLTQRHLVTPSIVICPNSSPALMAVYGEQIQTVGTEGLSVKLPALGIRELLTTDVAGKGVFHLKISFQVPCVDSVWYSMGRSFCNGTTMCLWIAFSARPAHIR